VTRGGLHSLGAGYALGTPLARPAEFIATSGAEEAYVTKPVRSLAGVGLLAVSTQMDGLNRRAVSVNNPEAHNLS
jgi:hypothetical protein